MLIHESSQPPRAPSRRAGPQPMRRRPGPRQRDAEAGKFQARVLDQAPRRTDLVFKVESDDSLGTLGQEDTIGAVRAAARAAQKETRTETTSPHEPLRSKAPRNRLNARTRDSHIPQLHPLMSQEPS